MSDSYGDSVGGSLKLKGVADGGVKKKKKKRKSKELSSETSSQVAEEVKDEKVYKKVKTPAQLAFDKAQEKRQAKDIMERAKKTHKQRVEELNDRLDLLTEHYDIPKVSWTK